MRNLLATVPQGTRGAIAAIVRTICAQPDHALAMSHLRKVADALRTRFPRAATVLEEAAKDILAYRHPPIELSANSTAIPSNPERRSTAA